MRGNLGRVAILAAVLYAARRYYRNWGTTKEEWRMRLPGDELIKPPSTRTTEGITVDAPAEEVWQLLERRVDHAMTIEQSIDNRALVLRAEPPRFPWTSVISYHVLPRLDDQCRLLARTRIALRRPGQIVLAELAGPASALRTRGLLLTVKHEAESATRQVTPR